jgi:hypothetical protein
MDSSKGLTSGQRLDKFQKFPSIEQFRHVVKEVERIVKNNDFPILPTLTFKGTVKIHGTNAAVCKNGVTNEIWVQSRERILAEGKEDNAGFCAFVNANKDHFEALFAKVENPQNETICIFGEWAGGNIQKGVAVCQLPKTFYIFAVKVGEDPRQGLRLGNPDHWLQDFSHVKSDLVKNINDFKTFSIDIDFSNPQASQNTLVELTEAVEKECPVGKTLGVSGIGEGIVWVTNWMDHHLSFKTKGQLHSASKVKTLASVDTERLENLAELVEAFVTEARVSQAVEKVCGIHETFDSKKTGEVIKWVQADILKEESDTITNNGFSSQEVFRALPVAIRKLLSKF